MNVLLIGAGQMAIEYAKVLNMLNIHYTVISRGNNSALKFEQEIGKKVITGGLENKFSSLKDRFTHAIIATPLENLENNTLFLLDKGLQNILIEKPGATNYPGIKRINDKAKENEANVFIGYNRRFYSSVIEAENLIVKDGGIKSFIFEFTEWGHHIKKLNKTNFQLENWFIGNSTHIIDLAFYFGGMPNKISSYCLNTSELFPNGSIYSGAGLTDKGILFSYHANWDAPGSWKLELLTNSNRYIFRPLEKLKIQVLGSLEINEIEIDNDYDVKFKPGLYQQVNAFLHKTNLTDRLLRVDAGLSMMEVYMKMMD